MTSLVLERERLQDYTKNGPKVTPTFSAAEMQRRLDAIRAHMAGAGIDAALFTSYHCINYYSDFLFCYFGRRYGLVVTPILCAGRGSTKNGAAGSDLGRNRTRRHPGDKTIHSCVQGDSAICGHLPRCRHSRSWGLKYRCHRGTNPHQLTGP